LGNSNGEFPWAKKLKNTDLLRDLLLRKKKRRISAIHQILLVDSLHGVFLQLVMKTKIHEELFSTSVCIR